MYVKHQNCRLHLSRTCFLVESTTCTRRIDLYCFERLAAKLLNILLFGGIIRGHIIISCT